MDLHGLEEGYLYLLTLHYGRKNSSNIRNKIVDHIFSTGNLTDEKFIEEGID
jgi:hypothetical protein